MTVRPPYAATDGLTTETGPMANPANIATYATEANTPNKAA